MSLIFNTFFHDYFIKQTLLVDVSPQPIPVKFGILISPNPVTDNFTEVEKAQQ